MGTLLKTSVLVSFLLLLSPLVYCSRHVYVDLFTDQNCTEAVLTGKYFATSISFSDTGDIRNATFGDDLFNATQTFGSVILENVTGDVVSLFACQAGLLCNATGATLISFNLSDIGACSTAGPPGTQFDKFVLS